MRGREVFSLAVFYLASVVVCAPRHIRTPKKQQREVTPTGDAVVVDDSNSSSNASLPEERRLAATSLPSAAPTIDLPRISPPKITPGSGPVSAALAVGLLHERTGARVYYTTDGSKPTRDSEWVLAGSMLHLQGTYSCTLTVRAIAHFEAHRFRDSEEVMEIYEVQMGAFDFDRSAFSGRVGMAYLVPYYHGQNFVDRVEDDHNYVENGHSSKMVAVDLNTSIYKTVRIHNVETDLSEYYSTDMAKGLEYQRGTSAYKGQLNVYDIAALKDDSELRGFFHGFLHDQTTRWSTIHEWAKYEYSMREYVTMAELTKMENNSAQGVEICVPSGWDDPTARRVNRSSYSTTSHGFLSPFFNGQDYSGKAVRVQLSTLEVVVELIEERTNRTRCCTVNTTVEFCAVVEEEQHDDYQERDALVHFTTKDDFKEGDHAALTKSLDLTLTHPRLRGFVGGFSLGDYAYFVPHFDGQRPGHTIARVHAESFSTVEYMDLWDTDPELSGFFSGFAYETQLRSPNKRFGFLVPHCSLYGPVGRLNSDLPADTFTGDGEREAMGGDHTVERFTGKLVRLDLDNFGDSGSVTGLDLTLLDPDLRGFAGGVVVGRFGILIPYKNRATADGYFGKLVRIDLESFVVDKILDLTRYHGASTKTEVAGANLVGFIGGVAWGRYVVLVPHRNNKKGNSNSRSHSGLVVRLDVDDFTLDTVSVLDVAHVSRQQIPALADNELRGFLFGFAQGDYVFLVPHFARDFHGKLVRIDMRDFSHLAHLQATDASTLVRVGSANPFDANSTAWTGVQYLDLERSDPRLVGFSGGFATRSAEAKATRVISEKDQKKTWWRAATEKNLGTGLPEVADLAKTRRVVNKDIYDACDSWRARCLVEPGSSMCVRCTLLLDGTTPTAMEQYPNLMLLHDDDDA